MTDLHEAELRWLRQLYLEDLGKEVVYHHNKRPRVRHIKQWEDLDAVVRLNEREFPKHIGDKQVWCWADQHFYHKNIIEFADRPYANVDEMNETLVANYNDYVDEDDVCIWVGDVGFKNDTLLNELLDQCNGYKILVVGNHDFDKKKLKRLNFDEVHLLYILETLVFTHYPMDNIPWPWFNVHGHLHAYPKATTGHPLHYNVNCELINYRPINVDEIREVAKKQIDKVELVERDYKYER